MSVSQAELIKTEYFQPKQTLPLIIQPHVKGVELTSWAKNNQEFIQTQLLQHGAILFRNFPITTVNEFEQVISCSYNRL